MKKRARGGGIIAIPNFFKFSPVLGQKRIRDPTERIGTWDVKRHIELEDAAEGEKQTCDYAETVAREQPHRDP